MHLVVLAAGEELLLEYKGYAADDDMHYWHMIHENVEGEVYVTVELYGEDEDFALHVIDNGVETIEVVSIIY